MPKSGFPMMQALLAVALAVGPAMAAEASGGPAVPPSTRPVLLDGVLAAVRADAAQAWQIADAARLSVQTEPVTWPDGALGCPIPGRFYTQALVPGWRIVVRDGARERYYHASERGQWLACAAGQAGRPVPGAATR